MWMARYRNGPLVALRLLRAPTTTLAGSDIDIGAVASIPTAVVELLANGV